MLRHRKFKLCLFVCSDPAAAPPAPDPAAQQHAVLPQPPNQQFGQDVGQQVNQEDILQAMAPHQIDFSQQVNEHLIAEAQQQMAPQQDFGQQFDQ